MSWVHRFIAYCVFILLATISGSVSAETEINSDTVKFSCGDSEATIQSRGAASVTVDGLNIYIGTRQVTSINQNPIVKAFRVSNGTVAYCEEGYEITPVDGKGRGLHYDGTNLYGFFAVDGGSTTVFSNVASGNTRSWTRSVGPANSGNFAIVARLDPGNGDVTGAAFITARLSSGNSNSVGIVGAECTDTGNLRLLTQSFFSPRFIDGSRMSMTGDSPFDYTIEFTPDLKDVVYVSAVGGQTEGTASDTAPCLSVGATDVNADTIVSPADAIYVINRFGQAVGGNNAAADVDNDGDIDIDDATAVIGFIGENVE